MSEQSLRQRARIAAILEGPQKRRPLPVSRSLVENERQTLPRGSYGPLIVLLVGGVMLIIATLLAIHAGWQPGARQVENYTQDGKTMQEKGK